MMLDTFLGEQIDSRLVYNYFQTLINCFFKILPMRENNEVTLPKYMRNLQIAMFGCKEIIVAINNDAEYLILLSILQFLIDNPSCDLSEVKSEVFGAIAICNKLARRYSESEASV